MNYCSINDAWGRNNYISDQFSNYSSPVNKLHDKEHFSNILPPQNDMLNNNLTIEPTCNEYIIHINNCKKCYNIMRNKFRPKVIENFQTIVEDNKDIIVLILIGIFIILFFNMINNLTKN